MQTRKAFMTEKGLDTSLEGKKGFGDKCIF